MNNIILYGISLKRLVVSFLLSFVFFIAPTNGQDCARENSVFQPGEELIYKVYYNWKFVWIPAGEIIFQVQETDSNYVFSGKGRSYRSYDSFFRVRDYYESTVDKQSLASKEFVRYVEEGDYRKFDSLYFDYQERSIISFNGKTKDKTETQSFPMDTCYLDLISILYNLRNTDVSQYKPGESMDIKMFFDKEVFPINVYYEKKERKKIKGLGKHETIKIRPELIVGDIFKEGDIMNIWVSDDANKVPLMIESPISVGSVKAVLKSHSGLKYPIKYTN